MSEIVNCEYSKTAKEQECEELKKQINKQKNAKIQLSKLSDRQLKEFCDMKQALDEVERFIKEDVCDEECGFNWKKSCSDCDCRYNNIIDIISKAKDRKNA